MRAVLSAYVAGMAAGIGVYFTVVVSLY